MENWYIVLLLFASWMKEIISHPNTPAYIQAVAVIIAAWTGINYLKKRKAERRFDLVVETYKYCLEAYGFLMSLKQAPVIFKNRENVESFQNIGKKQFINLVSNSAEHYLDCLNKEEALFDNLYHCYAEIRLFFNKENKKLKPIEDLLWSRNRIKELLECLQSSKKLIEDLTDGGQNRVLKTIRNAMVQVWENIALTNWQEEYENKEEEIDGIKGVRKFYYLNDLMNKARSDIDEFFPKMISSKAQ